MSATDELRRLLDERGVEWEAPTSFDGTARYDTTAGGYWFHEYDGKITVHGLTPAQAIAATLGSVTCRDKGNIERFICSECGCRLDLQDDDWEPTMWLADGAAMVPLFCPNCGRRVE